MRPGFDALTAKIADQRPGTAVMYIDTPVKEQCALQFYVGRPDGGEGIIYVNPYTGSIQGEKSAFDLRKLHCWLLIPFTGRYSVGWHISFRRSRCCYSSRWSRDCSSTRNSGEPICGRGRGCGRPRRVFWGGFHRIVGLWSFPFVAIMSVTAMWLRRRMPLFPFA